MTVVGSVAVAAAGFLPWSRTGRSRSGLDLARTLHEVGLSGDGAAGILLAVFLFTPFLAAMVSVAAVARRRLLRRALRQDHGTRRRGAARVLPGPQD